MRALIKGRFQVRRAKTADDLISVQKLRYRCFYPSKDGVDQDRFDATCLHFMIEERATGCLAGCFRMTPKHSSAQISASYSAQYYDLSRLQGFRGPMAELGRFCIAPEVSDPDVLRISWAMLTRYVDENSVEFLYGCSSFLGIDPAQFGDAFALLSHQHMAPDLWRPAVKSPEIHAFSRSITQPQNRKAAQEQLPSLLRTYLMMGGWVSDHAVIDRQLKTMHVFTGLEIASIPEGRKKLLRADAA